MEKTIHCTYAENTQVTIRTSHVQDILHTIHDGSGRYVTPGDMLVAALGACTLTMIGAIAKQHNQKIDGLQLKIIPTFGENLAGLCAVHMHIIFPQDTPPQMKARYLVAAHKCPVHNSLNADIHFTVTAE